MAWRRCVNEPEYSTPPPVTFPAATAKCWVLLASFPPSLVLLRRWYGPSDENLMLGTCKQPHSLRSAQVCWCQNSCWISAHAYLTRLAPQPPQLRKNWTATGATP